MRSNRASQTEHAVSPDVIGIVIGSGRCGTHSVARFLSYQRRKDDRLVTAQHETDWCDIVEDLRSGHNDRVDDRLAGFVHDVEVSPFLLLMGRPPGCRWPKQSRLVGVIRDGRATVRSGMTHGWYWNPRAHAHAWAELLPRFEGDRFEQCCKYWSWASHRLMIWNATIVSVEKLTSDETERVRLISALDLVATGADFPCENATTYVQPTGGQRQVAPPSDGDLAWPDPFPAPDEWGKKHREVFERHCGTLMDRFYPAWRGDSLE